jgi:hypothetical protein
MKRFVELILAVAAAGVFATTSQADSGGRHHRQTVARYAATTGQAASADRYAAGAVTPLNPSERSRLAWIVFECARAVSRPHTPATGMNPSGRSRIAWAVCQRVARLPGHLVHAFCAYAPSAARAGRGSETTGRTRTAVREGHPHRPPLWT